jgi:hypothetical protein
VLEGLGKSMAGKNEDSPEKKKGEVNSSAGKAPNSKAKKNDVSKQPSKVEQDYNKYKDYYESLLTHAHNKQNGRENSLDSYINQLKLEEAQGLINTLIHSRSRKEKLKNDCSEADVEALKKALIKRRDTLKTSSANFESGLEFKYVDVRPLSGKRLEDAISAAIKGEPNPAGTGKGKAA